ncbi:integration host factor, actinobacterial type [Streptomyces scopuliridis]|uniref:integration host factor, actinobacterial type n=1 Tax=Streptomyces scopuliridis TaxID=452529 RepID=UPI0035DDBC12
MALPPLSPEQRRSALDKAALASDSEAMRKVRVPALLESLPDIGKVRAQKILTEAEISESRRVRGLGTQQRERPLERFAPHR